MINVLQIPFFDRDIPAATDLVINEIVSGAAKGQNRCISASGAHGLVEAHKDPAFRQVLQSFYLNLPDGMPVVWVGRLKGAKQMKRGYGPDFFKAMMIRSADLPVKHFFCGGKEGVAEELKQKVAERFGNHRVVGTYCPPFREMTDAELQELGEIISRSGADIVWIGLSCPKQEKLARRLAAFTQTGFLVAVGAAFDFHTDRVKQAPRWIQHSGLEWLFRLFMEPKRLYKRYFEIVPGFIWLNVKEFVDFYTVKKKLL